MFQIAYVEDPDKVSLMIRLEFKLD